MHYNYSKALNFVTKNTLKLRSFCIIRMQKCQFHKQMQIAQHVYVTYIINFFLEW